MSPSRRGFSILEVMISLSILAIGISAVIGQMVTLNTARFNDRNSVAIDLLMNEIQERFQGSRWDVLGTDSLPWSLPRHIDATASQRQPMIDDPTKPTQDIVAMGLVSTRTGINGLKIYVEYYRATAVRVDGVITVNGMMDGEGTDYDGLKVLHKNWNDPLWRNTYRLDSALVPTAQVDVGPPSAPLLIRIQLDATGLARSRVLWTGRRQ